MQAAAAVIGAAAGGIPMLAWAETLAYVSLVLVGAFLLSQTRRLVRFYRRHLDSCWEGAEPISNHQEIEDPMLALLGRACCLPPMRRERGEFVVPDE